MGFQNTRLSGLGLGIVIAWFHLSGTLPFRVSLDWWRIWFEDDRWYIYGILMSVLLEAFLASFGIGLLTGLSRPKKSKWVFLGVVWGYGMFAYTLEYLLTAVGKITEQLFVRDTKDIWLLVMLRFMEFIGLPAIMMGWWLGTRLIQVVRKKLRWRGWKVRFIEAWENFLGWHGLIFGICFLIFVTSLNAIEYNIVSLKIKYTIPRLMYYILGMILYGGIGYLFYHRYWNRWVLQDTGGRWTRTVHSYEDLRSWALICASIAVGIYQLIVILEGKFPELRDFLTGQILVCFIVSGIIFWQLFKKEFQIGKRHEKPLNKYDDITIH